MSKKLVAILVGFSIVGLILTVIGGSYIGAYNLGNRSEKKIEAVWTNNKNILSQYYNKVDEMVQVPEMYKNDFKEVITSALEKRYGEKGSQAVFQWLNEHQINYDSSLYIKIQQVIEAGRNEFEQAQTMLIDVKRIYQTSLGSFWSGFWLSKAGYPNIDLSKFDIVTTEKVEKTFESKIETALTLKK